MSGPRLNHMQIIGRLCADPSLRYTNSGIPVCTFTVAVDRGYKREGQSKPDTDFFDCEAWRKLAEIMANTLSKGRIVYIAGEMYFQTYEAQDGAKRKTIRLNVQTFQYLDKPPEGSKTAPDLSAEDIPLNDEVPF